MTRTLHQALSFDCVAVSESGKYGLEQVHTTAPNTERHFHHVSSLVINSYMYRELVVC